MKEKRLKHAQVIDDAHMPQYLHPVRMHVDMYTECVGLGSCFCHVQPAVSASHPLVHIVACTAGVISFIRTSKSAHAMMLSLAKVGRCMHNIPVLCNSQPTSQYSMMLCKASHTSSHKKPFCSVSLRSTL